MREKKEQGGREALRGAAAPQVPAFGPTNSRIEHNLVLLSSRVPWNIEPASSFPCVATLACHVFLGQCLQLCIQYPTFGDKAQQRLHQLRCDGKLHAAPLIIAPRTGLCFPVIFS